MYTGMTCSVVEWLAGVLVYEFVRRGGFRIRRQKAEGRDE